VSSSKKRLLRVAANDVFLLHWNLTSGNGAALLFMKNVLMVTVRLPLI
jgi:hypothetical protein